MLINFSFDIKISVAVKAPSKQRPTYKLNLIIIFDVLILWGVYKFIYINMLPKKDAE